MDTTIVSPPPSSSSIFNTSVEVLANDCGRGELMLTDEELKAIAQVLGENRNYWRFENIDEVFADGPFVGSNCNRFQKSSSFSPTQAKTFHHAAGLTGISLEQQRKKYGKRHSEEASEISIESGSYVAKAIAVEPQTTRHHRKIEPSDGAAGAAARDDAEGNIANFAEENASNQLNSRQEISLPAYPTHHGGISPKPVTQADETLPVSSASILDLNNGALQHKRSQLAAHVLSSMPDWARRFHKVVNELCMLEKCQPFVVQVTPADPHYEDLANRVYPSEPLTLETVLEKLESNVYFLAADAFNDVQTVFLCAFRYYEPGSEYWMTALEISHLFESMLKEEKIFDEASSEVLMEGGLSSQNTPSSAARYAHTYNSLDKQHIPSSSSLPYASHHAEDSSRNISPGATGIDDMLQIMISKNREKKISSSAGRKRKKEDPTFIADREHVEAQSGYHRGGKRKRKYATSGRAINAPRAQQVGDSRGRTLDFEGAGAARFDNDSPVKDKERIHFQQLLLQLNQKQHFELFNEYQNQAVWRTLEGGEVELDDRGTLPKVFREMVGWCHAQLQNRSYIYHGNVQNDGEIQNPGAPLRKYSDSGASELDDDSEASE